MKRPVVILFLGISMSAFCQDGAKSVIDSLATLIPKTSGTAQADVLNQIALLEYNIDLKHSLSRGEEALALSQRLGYDKGTQQALNILMRVNRRLGNFTVAIELTLQKIPIAEKLRDTIDLVDSYSSLGNIYSSLERYPESKSFLNKAYVLGRKINPPNLAAIMNFIGRAEAKMNHYDSALYWIKEALAREQRIPQPGYTLSYIYNNLGEVYFYVKRYDEAIVYYTQSMRLAPEQRSPFGMTYTLNGLAKVYKEKKEYDQAVEYVVKSLEVSRQNSYRDRTKESYGILHEIYEDMQDYKNALHYYKLFNLYQDSIFSEDKLQYIENLKVNYETDKVARENELLKKDADLKDANLKVQRSLILGATIAVISLVGLLIFLYRNYSQKKKTNLLLSEYNENLAGQVEERTHELVKTNLELIRQNNQLEQFGFITAHNLRAPVARILGLASIIDHVHFKMPDDKPVLEKLRISAVELDAIIHDLNAILDIKKGVHNSYEEVNIHDRLEKVKSILKDKIQDSGATIEEDLQVHRCNAIPAYIESMIYNLVSNAIKYRSMDRPLVITVSTAAQGEFLVMRIQDNGIGIDLGKQKEKVFSLYQRFHDHVEGKGIGLFLVKTQVEALNGRVEIDSKVNVGTTFVLFLPVLIKPGTSA